MRRCVSRHPAPAARRDTHREDKHRRKPATRLLALSRTRAPNPRSDPSPSVRTSPMWCFRPVGRGGPHTGGDAHAALIVDAGNQVGQAWRSRSPAATTAPPPHAAGDRRAIEEARRCDDDCSPGRYQFTYPQLPPCRARHLPGKDAVADFTSTTSPSRSLGEHALVPVSNPKRGDGTGTRHAGHRPGTGHTHGHRARTP
jgi:hypothetical protein